MLVSHTVIKFVPDESRHNFCCLVKRSDKSRTNIPLIKCQHVVFACFTKPHLL